MTAKATIETQGDFLRVTITGVIRTIEEIAEYSRQYRLEANRLALRRVLIDYRKASFMMDYHDLLELAEYATSQGFQLHGLRIAALCSPEGVDLHRKYETIASNRSIAYRAFTDSAEAEEWLARS
ncbi:hypothetical protein [Pseudodesulfovibrio indicus]|uniref:hypothetical protein n=1 Tax=Pseudodesulfovibrio indicus TaxID=1716143 RepID=UPI00292F7DC8|nr:hypothetical protein [Pseudodesulfovibrio indicus]